MKIKGVLVIGNGESRKQLELGSILEKFVTVGCNAICRDYSVDHLICCDRRMAIEAIAVAPSTTTIYTRPNWSEMLDRFSNLVQVPELPYRGKNREDDPFQWGSGGYALLVGCLQGDNISIVGFDLWSDSHYVNNVYKNTANYSKEDSHAIDPSYWIYQIGKVFQLFPNKQFTIYNKENWKVPEQWQHSNVTIKNINSFVSENE